MRSIELEMGAWASTLVSMLFIEYMVMSPRPVAPFVFGPPVDLVYTLSEFDSRMWFETDSLEAMISMLGWVSKIEELARA
jgi:hypothetical protein